MDELEKKKTPSSIVAPFTVLVDTAEQEPYTFIGLRSDSRQKSLPLCVRTVRACLGRHPLSRGDYSIEGHEQKIAVERKSMADAWSTVLGWQYPHQRESETPGRRDRFKCELENLAAMDSACIVVEGSLGECLRRMPSFGVKSSSVNAKIFHRSIISLQQDYRVPWFFCDTRSLAEVTTYRFLERYYRKWKESER